jgi:hypothetical protein
MHQCVQWPIASCSDDDVLFTCRQPPALRPWGGFSAAAALSSLLPYLSVALPGAAMICLDWWAFEALTLLAGLLPGEWGMCRAACAQARQHARFTFVLGVRIGKP